jgi:3-dehydroquinate synthase class II
MAEASTAFPMQPAGQDDVVLDAEVGDQVEELEDVAHMRAAERVALRARHRREITAEQAEAASCGA